MKTSNCTPNPFSSAPNLKSLKLIWTAFKYFTIGFTIVVLSGAYMMVYAQHAPYSWTYIPKNETAIQQRSREFWADQNERWWINNHNQQLENQRQSDLLDQEMSNTNRDAQIRSLQRQIDDLSNQKGKVMSTTYIEEAEIYQCNDCGAYHANEKSIKHYVTCNPGESKRWELVYESDYDERDHR